MKQRIYLAGPIKGLTFDQSEDWRDEAKAGLPEFDCYSPLRAKGFLRVVGEIGPGGEGTDTYAHMSVLASQRGIMSRDHNDCQRADLILCNLLGARNISMGTVMEIAWAFAYRIPLVLCIEPGNVHDHPMIREAINFGCPTLKDAIRLTKTILLP